MQPQNNDFPIDQIKTVAVDATSDNAASDAGSVSQTSNQTSDQTSTLMGGTTFQPQANPSQPAPAWQQEAQADANMLGTEASDQTLPVAPAAAPAPAMPPTEPVFVPSVDATAAAYAPAQPNTLDMPMPEAASAPMPVPLPTTPSAQPVPEPQPSSPGSLAAVDLPLETTPGGSLPPGMPTEPQPTAPPDSMPVSYDQPSAALGVTPPSYSQPSALPGADQLAPVAAGLDTMGSYGPAPKKSKKMMFIIIGIVIGLALVAGGVYYFAVVAKKPPSTPTPTPTPTPAPTPTPTPVPTSGAATPPEGYATITKQCYSFALYVPNTVPGGETCTFATSTFGQKAISTIAVETKTDVYQKIGDYLENFAASVTVISTSVIKLDGLDATQAVYKAPDGKTYSIVALLVVGKKYQQDGKTVTVVAVTTSYQDEFDKTVTKNVLDTWRWQ